MPIDSRIHELLSMWESARARGETPTPEELCRDCPELVDELKRNIPLLESADRILQTPKDSRDTHERSTVAATREMALRLWNVPEGTTGNV